MSYKLLANPDIVFDLNAGMFVGVGVDTVESRAYQAWLTAGNTPHAADPPTLAQQAQTMLNAGCQIVSTSTPALNGTYPCDATSQQHVQAEITSIMLNGTFADGASTIAWLDVSDAPHTFSIAQFKTLATALAAFVSGALKVVNGQSTTLPSQPVTIP